MKKEKTKSTPIPELNIIDLDETDNTTSIQSKTSGKPVSRPISTRKKTRNQKKQVPLVVFAVLIVLLLGVFVGGSILKKARDTASNSNSLAIGDSILPLTYGGNAAAFSDGETNIVLFGNDTLAQNQVFTDHIAEALSDRDIVNIYNCAVSNTYLCASHYTFDANVAPMDAFNFYWLVTLATLENKLPGSRVLENNDIQLPPEAATVYDSLCSIDFNTVDVIGIMYDANDYLAGNPLQSAEHPEDIQTFTGNLEAGVELLKHYYPHIRIIVLSPTMAPENSKAPADTELSDYASRQKASAINRSISFIDCSTIEAGDSTGLAERFLYALKFYDEE